MRWISLSAKTVVLAGVVALGFSKYGPFEVRRLSAQIDKLEMEKTQLADYARRLQANRRVAQVDVVKQYANEDRQTVSVLLWQEIGPEGTLGKPVAVEAPGELVYFEGLVIKFDHKHVGEGDPQRGASVVMFRRIFGEHQAPETALQFDRAARPPKGRSEPSEDVEARLWDRFWELAENPELAAQYGVRIAQCEAPAVRVKPGQIWEVTLDAAGGLNLRKIGQRPAPDGV